MGDRSERRDFGLQMLRLARRWRNLVDGELRGHGLTMATWRALFHLGEAGGPMRPKDLAEALEMERPSLTQLLDKLEQSGLVVRGEDPDDHRGKRVTLSEAGREVHRHTVQTSTRVAQRLLGGISDEDMAVVLSVFRRLALALGEAEQAQSPAPRPPGASA